jgi:hypothetical protein
LYLRKQGRKNTSVRFEAKGRQMYTRHIPFRVGTTLTDFLKILGLLGSQHGLPFISPLEVAETSDHLEEFVHSRDRLSPTLTVQQPVTDAVFVVVNTFVEVVFNNSRTSLRGPAEKGKNPQQNVRFEFNQKKDKEKKSRYT